MWVAAILFLAAIVQGLVGFALAIVAVPLLVWHGLSLSEAIAIGSASTLIQAVTGMIKLRRSIPWESVRPSIVLRLIALPIGIAVLVRLDGLERDQVKAVLGGLIVLLVVSQLVVRVEPRERLSKAWDTLAFSASGFFAGMVGMGGPPLVLWLAALKWPTDRMRAFLFANFALLAPVNLLLIAQAFGQPAVHAMGLGVLMAPVVIVGGLIGVKLGSHLPREVFRKILFAILIAMGLGAMVSAWV